MSIQNIYTYTSEYSNRFTFKKKASTITVNCIYLQRKLWKMQNSAEFNLEVRILEADARRGRQREIAEPAGTGGA